MTAKQNNYTSKNEKLYSADSPIWSSNMEIFVISAGIHAERRPHALNSDATASRLGGKRLKKIKRGEDSYTVQKIIQ